MDILNTIQAHVRAMRLPLYAVTLSAVAKPDTPLILTLHWHGFLRETTVKLPGVPLPMRSVAGSALQIDEHWTMAEHLDQSMLSAAWQMGAWDLERVNHRPWWRLNAPLSETLACRRAFACYSEKDEAPVLVQAPDQSQLLEWAAVKGYIRWLFRPRVSGVWGAIPAGDATLRGDGSREYPCPVLPAPYDRHKHGRIVYRLGTGHGLLV